MSPHTLTHRIFLALLTVAAAGCSLDELQEFGDTCPPKQSKSAKLAYVQTSAETQCRLGEACYEEAFTTGKCPKDFAGCYLDSNKNYYCLAKCPAGQIACDGRCISPETDKTFCGATDSCNNYGCCENYTTCSWWESCQSGKCVETICEKGQTRCIGGVVQRCVNHVWEKLETCQDNACNAEQTNCRTMTSCIANGEIVLNGEDGCMDGDIVTCSNGRILPKESCSADTICTLSEGTYKCMIPTPDTCTLNGQTIAHGSFACDGQLRRGCFNGYLDAGTACPPANHPDRTFCKLGTCVVPDPCIVGNKVIAHTNAVCDGNRLKKCVNGALDEGTDCMDSKDGRIFCRDRACVIPNDCDTVKHNTFQCNENNQRTVCLDGSIEVYEDCGNSGTCSPEGCIPRYNKIRDIHLDYDRLVDSETCATSSEGQRPAEVVIEGVVTTIRPGNGFFLQEPSADGQYAGINVYCYDGYCNHFDDAERTTIAVGDNVRVTAQAINSYYCQLQLITPTKTDHFLIEKLDTQNEIKPAPITADNITDDPRNPYNSSLVSISPVTITDSQEEAPKGWRALDAAGNSLLIGKFLSSAMSLDLQSHYNVTGIVYYYYNHSQIAPRQADDISPYSECAENENSVKCMKLAGEDRLIACSEGKLDAVNSKDCSTQNMVCDSQIKDCRARVSCTDYAGNPVQENTLGCPSENQLAKCTYKINTEAVPCDKEADPNCEDIAPNTVTSLWDEASKKSCPHGCLPEKAICSAPPLETCSFSALDPASRRADVKVVKPAGAELSTSIKCSNSANAANAIQSWSYTAEATVTECADCGDMTLYTAPGNALPSYEGKYTCVAIVSVADGKRYLCPTLGTTPLPFDDTTTLKSLTNVSHSYTVSRPVLAYWSFDAQNADPDDASLKPESTFSLVNAGSASVTYTSGIDSSSKAIAAQAKWSEALSPNYASDPHWEIQLDTKGYQNLSLSFRLKASGSNSKSFRVAYKTGDSNFEPVGTDLIFDDANTYWHSWNSSLSHANDQSSVTIGIFPFATKSQPNIRIDEVRITADAL